MSKMPALGVFEIFFGPAWPSTARKALAPVLRAAGYEFYIYGPKSDSSLRKNWAGPWPRDFLPGLHDLSETYRAHGLKFGVAFSPFGTQGSFGPSEKKLLEEQVSRLDEVGLDYFGLFFDDMPSGEGLAARQMEVLDAVIARTRAKIIFCPSYYSDDPILDRVFGARPENYLSDIGRLAPAGVEIAWTGPKVISPEITADHLTAVAATLRRAPFVCDNIFANDGPKNCKFLKVKPLAGRDAASFRASGGWALNPMNQIELSRLVLEASAGTLLRGEADAFERVIAALPEGPRRILSSGELAGGLDALEPCAKQALALEAGSSEVGLEIAAWLEGEYSVGAECLTD